jgi:hypothetical protein
MDALDRAGLIDEDTVLPAVALWWRTVEDARAQSEIDHLGSNALATDWGSRIISNRSQLYDPLSYHYGSVWPLFTGWASMGAYRYGRPHVGFQALMSNVLLREQGALGYTTELLSGDYNAPFGRSSHHQVWSEAMNVTPLLRGLLGLEVIDLGSTVRFAPQLPADWDKVLVKRVSAGGSLFNIWLERRDGEMDIVLDLPEGEEARKLPPVKFELSPAFPLDARVKSVEVNGAPVKFTIERTGDVQSAVFETDSKHGRPSFLWGNMVLAVVKYEEGTDAFVAREAPRPGDTNTGLRVLRSRGELTGLRLLLEGLAGREYTLSVRSRRTLGLPAESEGLSLAAAEGGVWKLGVKFAGEPGRYARREIVLPFKGTPEPLRRPAPKF